MWCTTGVNLRTTPFYTLYECFVSQFLKPILFIDDSNLFCSNKEIKPLLLKANLELEKNM